MTLWRTHPKRIALALSAAMFAIPAITALLVPRPLEQPFGVDFILYRDAAARWLAGGPYFEPYQLAGPYPITAGDVLYPPVALWLFVPFTVLPAVLWWAIPIAVAAWAVWRLQPSPEWWPLIALCIAWRRPFSRPGPAIRSSGAWPRWRSASSTGGRPCSCSSSPASSRSRCSGRTAGAGGWPSRCSWRCACRSPRCGPTG